MGKNMLIVVKVTFPHDSDKPVGFWYIPRSRSNSKFSDPPGSSTLVNSI